MGFDLFLAAVSIVAAAIATWALLRLFPSTDAPTDIPPRPETRQTKASQTETLQTDDASKGTPGKTTASTDIAVDATDAAPVYDHPGKRLAIALVLTVPTLVVTLLSLAGIALSSWMTNPWLHAIIITPVMFYCAAPIHQRGLPALRRRRPNGDSLVSLGMAIVYVYSLLLCVISWIFPAGSRDPYFAFVGVVTALSLTDTIVRHRLAARSQTETGRTQANSAEETLFRAAIGHEIRARVLQITTSVTMVVAVWTCALWLAFGVQPKLAIAMLLGSTVLSVAGLVLQAYDRLPEPESEMAGSRPSAAVSH